MCLCIDFMITKNNMCEKKGSNFVSIREAVSISGMCAQTLRKLGDEQKIRCYKTPSGQRKFDKNSLEELFDKKIINTDNKKRYIYISNDFYDISENKTKIDKLYKEYIILYKNDKKGLNIFLEECLNNDIDELVIFEKDILDIDNNYILYYLITKHNCKIIYNFDIL